MRCQLSCFLSLVAACAANPRGGGAIPDVFETQEQVAEFIDDVTTSLEPLVLASNLGWFDASVTGTDEAWQRSTAAEDALNRFWSDPQLFAAIEAARASGVAGGAMDARQLDLLYRAALGKQVDPAILAKITALQSELEKAFNTYRGQVAGEPVTDNQINQVLRNSTDSAKLEEAWRAQKGVAPVVAKQLAALVRMRNDVARRLGYRDFFAMRMAEEELDEDELVALFDELDRLTREPFATRKAEVDERLAKHLGVEPSALMPWHYQNAFFQETPNVFHTGLGPLYAKQDTLATCRSFFESIGLEVEAIIARSDLYEKEGKTQHAFAAHIDRKDDVRVIANIVSGLEWQNTMVHELGHAVYDVYLDRSLPWLLREATHAMTTEGVAMMFDRLVGNPAWAHALGAISAEERDAAMAEAQAERAFASLVFSRWTQVVLRFERAMYANPDQDLNSLWWDLVEEHQGLRRPEGRDQPDYASKIHIALYPVYYQNYMLGELFAAQLHEKLAAVQKTTAANAIYVNHPEVGTFLKEQVFAPGALYPWSQLVERTTGAPLSPEAFARRF